MTDLTPDEQEAILLRKQDREARRQRFAVRHAFEQVSAEEAGVEVPPGSIAERSTRNGAVRVVQVEDRPFRKPNRERRTPPPGAQDPSAIAALSRLEGRLAQVEGDLQKLTHPGAAPENGDDRMFHLLKDVAEGKAAQEAMARTIEALLKQTAELSALARELNATIARAPVPATYTVALSDDREAQVSGRDALEFVCAVMVAADVREARLKLSDGSSIPVDVGDLEQVCRQIVAQMAGGK